MKRKTILITGANSGLGKAIAKNLSISGQRVIMLCRDQQEGENARAEIMFQSGNSHIQLYCCDLMNWLQIKECASNIISDHKEINVLINNAGYMGWKKQETIRKQLEPCLAINYLAPFILTLLLYPKIQQTKNNQIINIGSSIYKWGKISWSGIRNPNLNHAMLNYANSKYMLTVFTGLLASKLDPGTVKVNCIDPGIVNTNIGRHMSFIFRAGYDLVRFMMASTEKSSLPVVDLVNGETVYHGKLLKNQQVKRDLILLAKNKISQSLWEDSLKITGIKDSTK